MTVFKLLHFSDLKRMHFLNISVRLRLSSLQQRLRAPLHLFKPLHLRLLRFTLPHTQNLLKLQSLPLDFSFNLGFQRLVRLLGLLGPFCLFGVFLRAEPMLRHQFSDDVWELLLYHSQKFCLELDRRA